MSIVIYHNPDCGTSRNVLAFIRSTGQEPVVIEYLTKGWGYQQLQALFAAAKLTPRTALRTSKSPAKELGLLDESVDEEHILQAMLQHPVLVNRPIVCTSKAVHLCRPSESVFDILDPPFLGPLSKEDGELVINKEGERVV